MSTSKKKINYVKHYVVIFVWIAIIVISFSSRGAISEGVSSSSDIVTSTSDSTRGSDLYKERFNINQSDTVHILIIELPEGESFLTNEWRNYTLFLIQYLNDTLFDLGYDQYINEAVLHMAGFDEFGRGLVSDDETTALLNIISSTNEIGDDDNKLADDVMAIRNLVALENVTKGVYDKAKETIPDAFFDIIMPDSDISDKMVFTVTGNSANFVDMLATAKESFERSELLAVIVAIIILALVFKSPLGIFIPMFAMVASLLPTYLITVFLGNQGFFAISDFLPAMIGMIGIAVAVDYNLFSLVRFREEFRKRKAKLLDEGKWDKEHIKITQVEAATRTNKTTGQAVMYSGFTVIIGFSSMLVLGSDFTLGLAISISIVVAISILTARTLTVSILSLFGRALDWPNFMSGSNKQVEEMRGRKVHKKTIWERWSKIVLRKPITFLFIGTLTMVPFVVISFDMDLSFDMIKSLPKGVESRDGFEILQENFDFGSINPIEVVIDLGENTNFFAADYQDNAETILDSLKEFSYWAFNYSEERSKDSTLMTMDTVSTVSIVSTSTDEARYFNTTDMQTMFSMPEQFPARNLTTGAPLTYPNGSLIMVDNPYYPQSVQFIKYMSKYINLENGNNTIYMEITTQLDPGSAAAWELIEIIRTEIKEIFGDNTDIDQIYVTGLSAIFKDSKDEMYENVPLMLVVATTLIFLALLVLFRSIVLPIKAILTISGSILFGLGSLVLIFQFGWLTELSLGEKVFWESEIVGIMYFLPTFLFTTILGLGMDYSILIISRIKEEYDRTGNMDESVGVGISKTAGVITSAATVMITTFLVFAGSEMLVLKMMGIAMAIAIAVDATISRILLLPAAMKLLGKQNWWIPKWLDKILPKIELEH